MSNNNNNNSHPLDSYGVIASAKNGDWASFRQHVMSAPAAELNHEHLSQIPPGRRYGVVHQMAYFGDAGAQGALAFLLERHPRVNLKVPTRETPPQTALQVAVDNGASAEFLDFLKERLMLQILHECLNRARDGEFDVLFALQDNHDEDYHNFHRDLPPHMVDTVPAGRQYGLLHQAAFYGHIGMLRALWQKTDGALNLNVMTREAVPQTARQVAESRGHTSFVFALQELAEQQPEESNKKNGQSNNASSPKPATYQKFATIGSDAGYPSALTAFHNDYGCGYTARSLVELQLTQAAGAIREKEQWWRKLLDNNGRIATKWQQELQQELQNDHAEDEDEFDATMAQNIAKYVIAENTWLAKRYETGPVRPAAVDGVFCRDDLDATLQNKLLEGVSKLRAAPAIGHDKEDRHPGTPAMVDLVHPSLYCYEHGKSGVLPDVGAEATAMPEWEEFLGKQGVPEEGPIDMPKKKNQWGSQVLQYSGPYSKTGLQWLPAEFKVSPDGKKCDINSYINSLHPKKYAELYDSIGQLFCHALPLFEEVLAEAGKQTGGLREPHHRVEINHDWWEGEPREQGEDESDTAYDEYMEEWEEDSNARQFKQPTVSDFPGSLKYNKDRADVNLRNRPLQVICKLASLELEPGSTFGGGVWHVEGTLHERIVATACYYLECDNVTGGELAFRTSVQEPNYEQGDDNGVRRMYGLENEEALVQDAGSCVTKAGRVLCWPNTKQHRVYPVHTVDSDKPGKRTICCFFLVDPTLRVRSTATVPPQQLAWVADSVNPMLATAGAAMGETAIQSQISQQLASPTLLTYEAACKRRSRLMAERRAAEEGGDNPLIRQFSLCEH